MGAEPIERTVATGAAMRLRGPTGGVVALTVNGGTARDVPGTWSATTEYVVRELSPALPDVGWVEVRYRIRSWKRHEMCIADAAAVLDAVAAMEPREVVLIGYSLGGAVATQIAHHPLVRHVIGLAPWLPAALPMDGMRGRRFDVLHGALDRYLPGVPGVSPESSRAGFDRILALGATGSYRMIPLATHAVALRAPWGGLIPAPRAREWVRLVGERLTAAAAGTAIA